MNILVVDDSLSCRVFLRNILVSQGFKNIIMTSSANEVYEVVGITQNKEKFKRRQKVDLILLDLHMPNIHGLEVCERIKQEENLSDIPIIIVSGEDKPEYIERAFSLGAIDYVKKPYNQIELKARVQSALRLKREIDRRKWREFELLQANKRIEMKNKELEQLYIKLTENVQKAYELQKQFLPTSFPAIASIRFAAYYMPSEYIGGDFYYVREISDKQILIYLTDVSGHGMDGAIVNVFVKQAFDQLFEKQWKEPINLEPKNILHYITETYFRKSFPDEYFLCMSVGLIDLETNKFTYCNAGFQTMPIFVKQNGDVQVVVSGGLPISTSIDFSFYHYEEEVISLDDVQTGFLYTDGLIEEENENKEMFGIERVMQIIRKNHTASPTHIKNAVVREFARFTNKLSISDDVTFLLFQFMNH